MSRREYPMSEIRHGRDSQDTSGEIKRDQDVDSGSPTGRADGATDYHTQPAPVRQGWTGGRSAAAAIGANAAYNGDGSTTRKGEAGMSSDLGTGYPSDPASTTRSGSSNRSATAKGRRIGDSDSGAIPGRGAGTSSSSSAPTPTISYGGNDQHGLAESKGTPVYEDSGSTTRKRGDGTGGYSGSGYPGLPASPGKSGTGDRPAPVRSKRDGGVDSGATSGRGVGTRSSDLAPKPTTSYRGDSRDASAKSGAKAVYGDFGSTTSEGDIETAQSSHSPPATRLRTAGKHGPHGSARSKKDDASNPSVPATSNHSPGTGEGSTTRYEEAQSDHKTVYRDNGPTTSNRDGTTSIYLAPVPSNYNPAPATNEGSGSQSRAAQSISNAVCDDHGSPTSTHWAAPTSRDGYGSAINQSGYVALPASKSYPPPLINSELSSESELAAAHDDHGLPRTNKSYIGSVPPVPGAKKKSATQHGTRDKTVVRDESPTSKGNTSKPRKRDRQRSNRSGLGADERTASEHGSAECGISGIHNDIGSTTSKTDGTRNYPTPATSDQYPATEDSLASQYDGGQGIVNDVHDDYGFAVNTHSAARTRSDEYWPKTSQSDYTTGEFYLAQAIKYKLASQSEAAAIYDDYGSPTTSDRNEPNTSAAPVTKDSSASKHGAKDRAATKHGSSIGSGSTSEPSKKYSKSSDHVAPVSRDETGTGSYSAPTTSDYYPATKDGFASQYEGAQSVAEAVYEDYGSTTSTHSPPPRSSDDDRSTTSQSGYPASTTSKSYATPAIREEPISKSTPANISDDYVSPTRSERNKRNGSPAPAMKEKYSSKHEAKDKAVAKHGLGTSRSNTPKPSERGSRTSNHAETATKDESFSKTKLGQSNEYQQAGSRRAPSDRGGKGSHFAPAPKDNARSKRESKDEAGSNHRSAESKGSESKLGKSDIKTRDDPAPAKKDKSSSPSGSKEGKGKADDSTEPNPREGDGIRKVEPKEYIPNAYNTRYVRSRTRTPRSHSHDNCCCILM